MDSNRLFRIGQMIEICDTLSELDGMYANILGELGHSHLGLSNDPGSILLLKLDPSRGPVEKFNPVINMTISCVKHL